MNAILSKLLLFVVFALLMVNGNHPADSFIEFGFHTSVKFGSASIHDFTISLFYFDEMYQCDVVPDTMNEWFMCDTSEISTKECNGNTNFTNFSMQIDNNGGLFWWFIDDAHIDILQVLIIDENTTDIIDNITAFIPNNGNWIGNFPEPGVPAAESRLYHFNDTGNGNYEIILDPQEPQETPECQTNAPTKSPTTSPTKSPTKIPTQHPTEHTAQPSNTPTKSPTGSPTPSPTLRPTTAQPTTAQPTKSPTQPPVVTSTTTSNPIASLNLNCPNSAFQIDGINADIDGCGLEECIQRYDKNSINECNEHCDSHPLCKSYTWVPKGGDQNHLEDTVCTIYDSMIPNQMSTSSKQIMCTPYPIPITCGQEINGYRNQGQMINFNFIANNDWDSVYLELCEVNPHSDELKLYIIDEFGNTMKEGPEDEYVCVYINIPNTLIFDGDKYTFAVGGFSRYSIEYRVTLYCNPMSV